MLVLLFAPVINICSKLRCFAFIVTPRTMKRAQHLVLCLFASLVISQVCGDVALYDGKTGQLENNWENWSWATVSLTSTDYVAPGDK